MSTEAIQPEEYKTIAAQYQQWLADRDLTIALLNTRMQDYEAQISALSQAAFERDELRNQLTELREQTGTSTDSE